MAHELTLKQELFVTAYLGEARGIGVRAARIAGYAGSDRALRVMATKLLANANVAAQVAESRAAIRQEGIACVEERIAAKQERWLALQQIIAERAELYATVPGGGQTGHMVRQLKGIGSGDNFREVEEYVVDTGLLAELHRLEDAAGEELGQRESNHNIVVTQKALVGVNPEEM